MAARSATAAAIFLALMFVTGHQQWLTALMMALCLLIVHEGTRLTPLGVCLNWLAMIGGFVELTWARGYPAIFVASAAGMAFGTIWLASHGRTLRTLGNFTFIAALYLSLALTRETSSPSRVEDAMRELPYLAMGLLLVLGFALCDEARTAAGPGWRLFQHRRFGDPVEFRWSALAIVTAVGLSATIVVTGHVADGQWVIWSSASVVTGNLDGARDKAADRAIGALIGVPIGIGLGDVLPHDTVSYGLAAGCTLITLAINRYRLAFAIRCVLATVALNTVGGGVLTGGQRLSNVILGSGIGVLAVFAAHHLHRILRRRTSNTGEDDRASAGDVEAEEAGDGLGGEGHHDQEGRVEGDDGGDVVEVAAELGDLRGDDDQKGGGHERDHGGGRGRGDLLPGGPAPGPRLEGPGQGERDDDQEQERAQERAGIDESPSPEPRNA